MPTPVRITFRHMPPSPALETHLREQVDRLGRFYDQIIGCDIVVGAPTGHHQNGAPFEVRVELEVPNANLHVNNEGHANRAHADVYVAVRDVFEALERKLKKRASLRHRPRGHETIRRGTGTET